METHKGEKTMFRFKTILFVLIAAAFVLAACAPAAARGPYRRSALPGG